ncbi:Polyadenylate-binding protein 3 [Diplonema papillatum]|nr:Polyadenylate-binding protein 3 [Diplonema papillatum]
MSDDDQRDDDRTPKSEDDDTDAVKREEVIEEDADSESLAGSEDSIDVHIKDLKEKAAVHEQNVEKLRRSVKNKDPDERTIYVGQVDLSTLPEELYFDVFRDAGEVSKIVIHTDPMSSLPRGSAYVEFEDLDGAEKALKKNGLNWRGLKLQICMKRDPPNPSITRLDLGMGLMMRQPPPGLAAAGRPFGKGMMAGAGIGKGAPMMGKGLAGAPLPATAGMPIMPGGEFYSRGRNMCLPPSAGAPVYAPY